jgi:hypothetical protein
MEGIEIFKMIARVDWLPQRPNPDGCSMAVMISSCTVGGKFVLFLTSSIETSSQ